MKFNSLEDKLEEYYDKLKHPAKIIDNWAIIDIDALNELNKRTLTSISNISESEVDRIITTESKNNYIVIKYSPNFIATKVIDNEYNYLIKDWDLIAVDRETLYKGETNKLMTNKEIIKLLGFKLNKKARLDLNYFN
jgi:hypothetical protein